MRTIYLLGMFGFMLAVYVLLFPQTVSAQVIINEVMADPAAASDKSEWVELYNYSGSDVDLRGWSLDGKLIAADTPVTITAGGYLVVTKTTVDFVTEFGNLPNLLQLGISLTNSGKTLTLTDGANYTDSITYTTATPSVSWERKGPLCADLVKHPTAHSLNAPNVAYATACYTTVEPPPAPPPPPPAPPLPAIQFSEVFPSPRTDKQEVEWVELYNWGDTAIDLSSWKLSDASSSADLQNIIVSPKQYVVLTGLSISLNNSGDALKLTDSAGRDIDQLTYTETAKGYAQMRIWLDNKYTTDLQVTARPTSGLTNVYQQDPDIQIVKEKQVVTEKVLVPAVCPVAAAVTTPVVSVAVPQYDLPATEVFKLASQPVDAQPEVPEFSPANLAPTWPLFLIMLGIALWELSDDKQLRLWLQQRFEKLNGRVRFPSFRYQLPARVRSLLLWFVPDR